MVIVMDMESGKRLDLTASSGAAASAYGDEVMFSGWAEMPREMPRLAEVAVERKADFDPEFLGRVYRSQC